MEQTEAEETMAALGEETRIAIGNGKTTAKRTEIAERSLVTIAVIAEMITKMIAMRGETKIAVTDVKSTTDTIDGRGATGLESTTTFVWTRSSKQQGSCTRGNLRGHSNYPKLNSAGSET